MTEKNRSAFAELLFVLPQYVLPHHFISRLVLRATRVRAVWFKNALMRWFVKKFNVNMAEASNEDLSSYPDFNSFFTRALKNEARPVDPGAKLVVCPVDGAISQLGYIEGSTVFQAKGYCYDLQSLLGGDAVLAEQFKDGAFATLYLSPRDYHRFHMPIAGRLRQMLYVPGRLFSVNPTTVRRVRNLFARNERVVAVFDSSIGPMVMIPVGALNVACIETVWHGVVTPPHWQPVQRWIYDRAAEIVQLEKGAEMGRFNMGSTVIMLFPKNTLRWDENLKTGDVIRMGQGIATLL